MDEIILKSIGIIHTPYKQKKNMPIQGRFKEDVEGFIKLKKEYENGLKDLEGFSHCILLYFFHKSKREEIEGKPYLEDKKHGIFAIRSPHRPNHIGLSVVKILKIKENILFFKGVDMLDKTPLIDIKPYVKHFDSRDQIRSGWLDKHFKNGKIPDDKIIL